MSTNQHGHGPFDRKAYGKQSVADMSAAEPLDRGGSLDLGLQQVQHRSYQHTIQIYHFRTDFMSITAFRNMLNEHTTFGYIDTLVGPDTQSNLYRPDGDEIPENTIEVAYLPDIFMKVKPGRGRGFALGFRTFNYKKKKTKDENNVLKKEEEEAIEWFCFDKPIENTILRSWVFEPSTKTLYKKHNVDTNNPKLLFNYVADIWKGTRKRTTGDAHQEHIDWHLSLMHAHLRSLKLKLKWDTFAHDYAAYSQAQRRAEIEAAPANVDCIYNCCNSDGDINDGTANNECNDDNEQMHSVGNVEEGEHGRDATEMS
jgi:hypothetical protein